MISRLNYFAVLLMILLFNCGHLVYIVGVHIGNYTQTVPIGARRSSATPVLGASAKQLISASDPLLLLGPILFLVLPVLFVIGYCLPDAVLWKKKISPRDIAAGWLVGSLIYLWMWYTPYYQWLDE